MLGSSQILTLAPPPAAGTTIAVEVVPYEGYGCVDTFYAKLIDTLTVTAFAGKDVLSCNKDPVPLGLRPKLGLLYSWTPAAGLSNPHIANPIATPDATTTYMLRTSNSGGGCVSRDTVVVTASIINNSLQLAGKAMFCRENGDSAVLSVQPTDKIQWYKNNAAIAGANQPRLRVTEPGSYYAMLANNDGCNIGTSKENIVIESARRGVTYPVQYAVIDQPFALQARQFGETVLWNPGTSLNNRSSYTPVFTGPSDQLYNIEITTIAGCVTIDTQMVKTVKQAEIYVPTAFTPNNDNLNDVLKPTLMGIKDLRYFRIFNRWGELIFETKTVGQGWNGILKGVVQPTQVFVWVAEGVGTDGRVVMRKGTSLLVR